MGSFIKSGGAPVATFYVWNEAGDKYRAAQFQVITESNEVRRDGVRSKGRTETYYKLEDGRSIIPVVGEADTFKIEGADEVVWKL
jgi:hypothetical protein